MSGRRQRIHLLGVAAACLWVGRVLAGDGAPPQPQDDKVAKLEALLEAQQKKIDALEQKVTAASQQDMDHARVEEMKKQIREVLSEQEFRESLMPSVVQAGYDKGFYIRSSDEKFMMKFNALFQMRYSYYATRKENRYLMPGFKRHDRSGFDLARMRFTIGGNVYTKDLTYQIEFDMSSPVSYNARLHYGWVNYRFVDEFQIKAGVFRLASTRANFGSSAKFQFVDWPMMDAIYGLGVGAGVRMWGQLFQKKLEYYVDIVNSLGTPANQSITTDENLFTNGHDNNPGIVGRVVWHALTGATSNGPPPDVNAHFDTPADIEHHTEPALDFGFHYAFAEDNTTPGTLRIPFPRKTLFRKGGFGLTTSNGLQINQFGFDAGFKYQGFSLFGEYVMRLLDVRAADHAPYTPLFLLTGDESTTLQHGAYLQAGYFLPIPGLENKLEVVGRVGGISALSSSQEGTWEYTGGLNYYIDGHRVKLQTDITKISEVPISSSAYSLGNVNDNALIWRVQLQVAF